MSDTTTSGIARGMWRLGIHGARQAGKTSYLATLYGFRAQADGVAVAFTNDETIDYLARQWDNYLAKGLKPQPTAKGMPTELDCEVKCQQRRWHVRLRDYAGELVQRKGADDVEELQDESLQWLMSCNAILFFIDITEPEDAVRERLNELDLLLNELHGLSVGGDKIARPLALILTKWDTRPDFNVCGAEAAAEASKATEFLRNSAVYGQVHSALAQSARRMQVFPVSAFGSHRDGQLPPANGPEPFNIHAPLKWAVEMAEEMIGGKADRDADAFLSPRWWPRYDKAADLLDEIIHEHAIRSGLVGERLAGRARGLRRRSWLRRLKVLTTSAVIILAVILVWLLQDESTQYKAVLHDYDDHSIDAAGIKTISDEYLARRNPFKRMHQQDVRDRWTQFQSESSQRDYQNLEVFRGTHSTEADANVLLKKEREYLALWGGSPGAQKVRAWEMEDAKKSEDFDRRIEEDRAFQELLDEVAAFVKANKFSEAEQAYHRFLGKYPESSHGTEIEKRISDMERAGDESEWKNVVDFDQKYPFSYDETIKRANHYLTKVKARHRPEAEALATRTGDRWDWALYEQVRNASRTGANANDVEATQRKAMTYLNGTQPRKRMKAEVQKWMDWFNGLQTAKDYKVIVRSMRIPKGSHLEPTLSKPECRIQISVGSRAYWTGWRIGMEPVYDETLGPFRFKWGQAATFAVQIEGYHPTWFNDFETRTEFDERFIVSRLNGPITVRDRNGLDVTVYLECEAVKQPDLAAYKDK